MDIDRKIKRLEKANELQNELMDYLNEMVLLSQELPPKIERYRHLNNEKTRLQAELKTMEAEIYADKKDYENRYVPSYQGNE